MRYTRWFALILVFVLALASVGPAGAQPGKAKRGQLSPGDQRELAEARARGDKTVTLLIAAQQGADNAVTSGIAGLGGTVRANDTDIGYVRAVVPIDKVEAAVGLAGVEAVELDKIIPLDDPRPDGTVPVTPQAPPGSATPRNNPYMPIGDTGATQFMAANRTWDGREVTVGIIDSGVDLHHPSLQTTSTGERKIVDWVTYTHPFDDGDPTWVNMQDEVSGATFSYTYTDSKVVVTPPPPGSPPNTPPTVTYVATPVTVTFTAPANGRYRIGILNEHDPRLGGEVGNDVNRDGNPAGSSGIFAVLWDGGNQVWVDANQNKLYFSLTWGAQPQTEQPPARGVLPGIRMVTPKLRQAPTAATPLSALPRSPCGSRTCGNLGTPAS